MNEHDQEIPTGDLLDDVIKPAIYSKTAIWGFSILFTTLFGGILVFQNLRDIQKKKEANIALLIAFIWTGVTLAILIIYDIQNRSATFLSNIAGAALLTEYFHRKYFPDEAGYQKKKIWKPLIIGILICVAFVLLAIWAQDQVV